MITIHLLLMKRLELVPVCSLRNPVGVQGYTSSPLGGRRATGVLIDSLAT